MPHVFKLASGAYRGPRSPRNRRRRHVPAATLELVRVRASQINGCAARPRHARRAAAPRGGEPRADPGGRRPA
ncbi:hypothetical protein ACU686_35880 [Yinghuangia aomiensis]